MRRSAPSFFRRYAMNPTPAKPRIIIAHVEGSGTDCTGIENWPITPANEKFAVSSNWMSDVSGPAKATSVNLADQGYRAYSLEGCETGAQHGS
jgi:hypothetical protein